MSQTSEEALDTLRDVWKKQGQTSADIDEACDGGATKKVCRNAVHMTFDGYAEEGEDVRTAWHRRLEQEGKINAKGGSLRDLIFGDESSKAAPSSDAS